MEGKSKIRRGLVELLWISVGIIYVVITFVISLAIGAFVLFAPYVPRLARWMETVTLYDLMPLGYVYAILMSLVGMGFFLHSVEEKSKHRNYVMRTADRLEYGVSILGTVIFIALLIGIFVYRSL